MFKKLFKKTPTVGPILLQLKFLKFEKEKNGIAIEWEANGAPSDVIFDVDFMGQPSGITTGFVWDNQSNVLSNVYVTEGDTSFILNVAWAYADNAMDGSGKAGAVWTFKHINTTELKFDEGCTAFLKFEFDPKKKQIQKV